MFIIARQSSYPKRCAMSYDTTVNDALDPPDARLPARQPSRRMLRAWLAITAALALVAIAGTLVWLLR